MLKDSKVILSAFERFTINNYTAIRRKARKPTRCHVCHGEIVKGDRYFELTLNGAGVSGFIHPAKVHEEHLLGYFK